MIVERIKMPFGNWSDLDKNPKVSVALNAERRDKAGPSARCQTIKPLTCLWDFEGTVLYWPLIPAYFYWQHGSFSLSLLLESHPMKQHQQDQSKSAHWTDGSAREGGWNFELVLLGVITIQGSLRLLLCLGQLETLLPLTRSNVCISHGRGVVRTPSWLFPPCMGCFGQVCWGSSAMAMGLNTQEVRMALLSQCL